MKALMFLLAANLVGMTYMVAAASALGGEHDSKDIVDTAVAAGQFKTLVAAV